MRKKRGKLQEDEVRYIEGILDEALDFCTETKSEKERPATASYEDIMEALGELESNNRLYLHGMFEQVIAFVDYIKSQRQEF